MLDLVVGAGITAVAYSFGVFSGRMSKNRNGPKPEICQCGHGSNYHNSTGCHDSVEIDKYDKLGYDVGTEWIPCACVAYVGPSSSYIPELADPVKKKKELS